MKDHPLSFKPEMVRAILEDPPRKTQTRRIVSMHNSLLDGTGEGIRAHWPHLRLDEAWVDEGPSPAGNPGPYLKVPCHRSGERLVHRVYPRIQAGDRIWGRESWHTDTEDLEYARAQHEDVMNALDLHSYGPIYYLATDGDETPGAGWRWRPSIHMPKWASRLWLSVVSVRPERVQDITAADVLAEGVGIPALNPGLLLEAFGDVWDDINAKKGHPWSANDWVWVYEFRRCGP